MIEDEHGTVSGVRPRRRGPTGATGATGMIRIEHRSGAIFTGNHQGSKTLLPSSLQTDNP